MAKVAPILAHRKARFRAALALAGVTAKDWAKRQGVTEGHLYAVLTGRQSDRLVSEIETFIGRHLPDEAA